MSDPYHIKLVDQFDIPPHLIPAGLSYQWCAVRTLGDVDPSYARMLASGWQPVPFQRHADFFSRRARNADGFIEIDGQVLMSRLKEVTQESYDLNADKAHRQGGANHRLTVIETASVMLNLSEMNAASALGISSQEYTRRRLWAMLNGTDWRTVLEAGGNENLGSVGALRFARVRRPRYPALRWLFNMISTEA